jgi:ribosomal protein S24E
MDLKITDKKDEKLLQRACVKGVADFGKAVTPSNDAVKDAIAKHLGKDAKLVVVKHIYTKFGSHSADVIAYVYDNEKKHNELEVSHKKPKKTKEGEAAAAPKKK